MQVALSTGDVEWVTSEPSTMQVVFVDLVPGEQYTAIVTAQIDIFASEPVAINITTGEIDHSVKLVL